MALIKILMAVYNGGKYIEKQIESILNQSFNDFTIKISDDGSDDNTADIAELYMKRCPGKIEFVKRQAHVKGAGENFFSLLDEAALYNNSYDICGTPVEGSGSFCKSCGNSLMPRETEDMFRKAPPATVPDAEKESAVIRVAGRLLEKGEYTIWSGKANLYRHMMNAAGGLQEGLRRLLYARRGGGRIHPHGEE